MVMFSPLGTIGTYCETGSSRLSLPSWASCTTTAAVIDFVFEAIRKWVSARGGVVVPSWVVPELTVKSSWGVRRSIMAPGTRSSRAVVSTMVCRAAWSIGLSADEPAGEPGCGVMLAPGDVVGVDAVCVAGVATVEHPASRRAVPTRTLATWRCPRRRRDRDRPMHVCTSLLLSPAVSVRSPGVSGGARGRWCHGAPLHPFRPGSRAVAVLAVGTMLLP